MKFLRVLNLFKCYFYVNNVFYILFLFGDKIEVWVVVKLLSLRVMLYIFKDIIVVVWDVFVYLVDV